MGARRFANCHPPPEEAEVIAELQHELLAHARREAPRECCGVLVENGAGLEVWKGRNVAEGEGEFLLDPRDQYSFLRRIGRFGYELAAIYHSHPRGPAALSETDRALAFYPVPLVVVSLRPEAICWFMPPPTPGGPAPL